MSEFKDWEIRDAGGICIWNTEKLNMKQIFIGSSAPGSPLKKGQCWFDTSVNKLKAYNGSTWDIAAKITNITEITNRDHGDLQGLSDDDHPQYLHLNKASQTLQQSLTVSAGKEIDGINLSTYIQKLLYWHAYEVSIYYGNTRFAGYNASIGSDPSRFASPITEDTRITTSYIYVVTNTLNGTCEIYLYSLNLGAPTSHGITLSSGSTGMKNPTQAVSIDAGDRIAWRIKTTGSTSGYIKIRGITSVLTHD